MSEIDDFVAALKGVVRGRVEPEGGHYRWTCEACNASDTHLNEQLASIALHTHVTHGCVEVVAVKIGPLASGIRELLEQMPDDIDPEIRHKIDTAIDHADQLLEMLPDDDG